MCYNEVIRGHQEESMIYLGGEGNTQYVVARQSRYGGWHKVAYGYGNTADDVFALAFARFPGARLMITGVYDD